MENNKQGAYSGYLEQLKKKKVRYTKKKLYINT